MQVPEMPTSRQLSLSYSYHISILTIIKFKNEQKPTGRAAADMLRQLGDNAGSSVENTHTARNQNSAQCRRTLPTADDNLLSFRADEHAILHVNFPCSISVQLFDCVFAKRE